MQCSQSFNGARNSKMLSDRYFDSTIGNLATLGSGWLTLNLSAGNRQRPNPLENF